MKKEKSIYVDLFLIFLFIAPVTLPLLGSKMTGGHDAFIYTARLVEFHENIKDFILFPRLAPDLAGGYGDPLFNFAPPLFYYISEFFYLLNLGLVRSINFACISIITLSAIGMYIFVKEILGRISGIVASVAYIYSPYFLFDLYVRHALSEFSAFPWLPLSLWAFYKIAYNKFYIILGSIFLGLIILSSNHVTVIFVPILFLYIIFLRGKFYILFLRILSLVFGFLLTSYFWIPSFFEKKFTHISRALEGYLTFHNHFVYFHQLIYSKWGYGISIIGDKDNLSFQIGVIHLLGILFIILFFKTIKKNSLTGFQHIKFFLFVFFFTIFLVTRSSIYIWEYISILKFLQFPWRFLILIYLSSSVILGAVILYCRTINNKIFFSSLIIFLIVTFNLPHAKPEKYHIVNELEWTPENIGRRNFSVTTNREYDPIYMEEDPPYHNGKKIEIIEGEGEINLIKSTVELYKFEVNAKTDIKLKANIHYFPGWQLLINGKEEEITYPKPYGIIKFNLPKGKHLVKLYFGDTRLRFISKVISIFTLLILFYLFFQFLKPFIKWNKACYYKVS